jgi:hypothetical protein
MKVELPQRPVRLRAESLRILHQTIQIQTLHPVCPRGQRTSSPPPKPSWSPEAMESFAIQMAKQKGRHDGKQEAG